MKALFSVKVLLLVLCLMFLSSKLKAQDDMGKPAPVKSATMEMMLGTWKSDPYDFFGSKWTDQAVHTMRHNGQYMFIDISGSDDKSHSYTGTIVISTDKDGNLTGWSFDDWGGVTTYTGKADGNKVTVTGKNAMMSETREIEINGSTMVHKVASSFKGQDGKDMTMTATVTYHKQ